MIKKKNSEAKSVILDGLNMPSRIQNITCSSSAYLKSFQGYQKPIFLVLKNSDLHMYQDMESESHMEMHVLQPGVFLQALKPIVDQTESDNSNIIKQKR